MIMPTTDAKPLRRRKRLVPDAKQPQKQAKQKRKLKDTDELAHPNDLMVGMSHPAQVVASRHGMYTISTAAKLVGRNPSTVRRWLRFEECPKPSQSIPYNAYEMQLFTDDDIEELKKWAAAQRPGRPTLKKTNTTVRRRPNEPFFRETEPRNPYEGTRKTLMAKKESPVEYWARMRGDKVVYEKRHTGTNTVTVQRIVTVDADRRIVQPNVAKKPRKGRKQEKRITHNKKDT